MSTDNRYSHAMAQFYRNTPKNVFTQLAKGQVIKEELLFSGARQAMTHHGYPLSDLSGQGIQVVLELGKGRIENTVGMEYHWIQLRHHTSGPLVDSQEFIFGSSRDLYDAWHQRLYLNPAVVSEYGYTLKEFEKRVHAHVATYFTKAQPRIEFDKVFEGLVKVRML